MSNFVIQRKLYWFKGPRQGYFSRSFEPIRADVPDAEVQIQSILNTVGSVHSDGSGKAFVDSVAVFEPDGELKIGVVGAKNGLKVWCTANDSQSVEW